ncbi:DUF6710 family protein [Escherichia coli]|uniref:DUF6710 family protein n=1 Tax=Escherichia coli TaxID=562 RepID=UPI002795CC9D|nr:DUF6710 family protein [Escherichia coli]MEA0468145.1 DUF6710 family protein [Escherichia coli]
MFWNRNKKDKATIANEKKRFNHLLSVAEKLPVKALPDLIRAIVRPVQSDFLLAVAEEGTDARSDMTPQEFFFKGLTQIQSYEKMKECEMNGADYPLSLASDIVLPWPWSLPRYIDNVSRIGTHKGKPWKQDKTTTMLTCGCPGVLALCMGQPLHNGGYSGRRRVADPGTRLRYVMDV